MKLRAACPLVCVFFLFAPYAWTAQPAPADPAKAQQIVTQVCAACHGDDGNSAIPANPNLARQIPEYTTKQLANFKSGERVNAIMTGMVAALSPEDMTNIGPTTGSRPPSPQWPPTKNLRCWVKACIGAEMPPLGYRRAQVVICRTAPASPSSIPGWQASTPNTRPPSSRRSDPTSARTTPTR